MIQIIISMWIMLILVMVATGDCNEGNVPDVGFAIVSSLVVELIPGKRPTVMGLETYYRRHKAGLRSQLTNWLRKE